MRMLTIVAASLLAVPAALACEGDHSAEKRESCHMPAPTAEALPADATQASLEVNGMTCGACATKVQTALKGVEGVQIANVDLDKKLVTIAYDKSKTDTAKMIAAVNATGKFTATLKN